MDARAKAKKIKIAILEARLEELERMKPYLQPGHDFYAVRRLKLEKELKVLKKCWDGSETYRFDELPEIEQFLVVVN